MIDVFVRAWDANQEHLIKSFEDKPPRSYKEILERLIEIVLNPYLTEETTVDYPEDGGIDIRDIVEINNGDYQGTLLYVMPFDKYQPSVDEYVYTYVGYGSCSSCDTLQRIQCFYNLDDEDNKQDKVGAAKEFHTLALHMLQRFKRMGDEI